MYSIRTNGDTIAQEFAKLLGNSQSIKKIAQDTTAEEAAAAPAAEEAEEEKVEEKEDSAEDNLSDYSDAALSDLLVEQGGEAVDGAVDSVNDAISVFSSQADPAGHYIMNGLGKIAGSLRNKGEAFAADVVEATALSIRGDLTKEAKRKSSIVSALNKMASNFSSNGDSFAADMVKVTINKISR